MTGWLTSDGRKIEKMTAKELKEKYEADIAELQKNCTHTEVSGWLIEQWAPGHCTGRAVKVCDICWATVEVRKDVSFEITSS